MLKVYGSEMCPDCINCKRNFDDNGIEYTYIDINKDLKDLKDFLKMRDENPIFDRLKAIGDIGIPAIVMEDDTVFTDWEGFLSERNLPITYENVGKACSIDGKGC